jgi:hypothetical protein
MACARRRALRKTREFYYFLTDVNEGCEAKGIGLVPASRRPGAQLSNDLATTGLVTQKGEMEPHSIRIKS